MKLLFSLGLLWIAPLLHASTFAGKSPDGNRGGGYGDGGDIGKNKDVAPSANATSSSTNSTITTDADIVNATAEPSGDGPASLAMNSLAASGEPSSLAQTARAGATGAKSGAAGGAGGEINTEACWVASYDRGVGITPTCTAGLEMDTGLCYPRCPANYRPVGPLCRANEESYPRGVGTPLTVCGGGRVFDSGLCYAPCPPGWRPSALVFCVRQWWEIRGRGVGTPPDQCAGGREKQNNLCYVPCKAGFRGDGPVCWNNVVSIPRGVGTPPTSCGANEMDTGLCYKKCNNGFKGAGPICWQDKCPSKYPFSCGALCTPNEASCSLIYVQLAANGIAISVANPVVGMLNAALVIGTLASWPKCDALPPA